MRRTFELSSALLFTLTTIACGGGEKPAEEMPAAEAPAAEAPAPAPAAGADLSAVALPEGVTAEMVEAGKTLYPTAVCAACHGPEAKGVPGMAPSLADATWLNIDGSYAAIVTTITEGVAKPKESPTPMPAKGGNAGMTDQQVKELAAYIFALSHAGA